MVPIAVHQTVTNPIVNRARRNTASGIISVLSLVSFYHPDVSKRQEERTVSDIKIKLVNDLHIGSKVAPNELKLAGSTNFRVQN